MNRLILIILALFPLFAFSQARSPGTITGRVIDSQTNTAVEYANVVLLDTLNKKMVTGAVSDSNGFFRLVNVPVGVYWIEYSFIGYTKQRSQPVIINKKNPSRDLKDLKLSTASVTMDEVTVTAEKNMLINKIDRKIFNVQQDITAQTGTVTDVLQNIPAVSVDMDGNISLRGSGNVTILINGMPSTMAGSATLDQMPASMVEKVEVITNPSARYRPDGTGGIINIVLKKEQKAGFNGSLAGNIGNHDRYNTTLQLNLNTGKVNLYGSFGFRKDYRRQKRDLYSRALDTTTGNVTDLTQNSTGHSIPWSYLGQLGMDWNISSKDVGGISGTYNYREVKRDDLSSSLYKNDSLQPEEEFTRSSKGMEYENSIGVAGYYEHTFNKETENRFRTDFTYQYDNEAEDYNYLTEYQLPAYPNGQDENKGSNGQHEIDLVANYTRPLWKNASLEAGYEGTMQLTSQDYLVTHYNYESSLWEPDSAQSNKYKSNQTVHALYATVNYTWKKLTVLAGLRAEEALVDLQFITLDTTANDTYFALYPTLHLSLQSGENEWQLNYSRRVNRPDGEDMNPVPEYRDPRNVFVGNPHLKPEDIHSVEFGYSAHIKTLNLVPTLFYRYKVNGFTSVTTSLNDTVLLTTRENLATDQSAGIDFSGTWRVESILNLNFGLSGFYSQIDASNIGYSNKKSTFAWSAKTNVSFFITKTTILQLNGNYRSEVLTPQGYRLPSWVLNLGFRQDFLKKKLSLVFTVSDIFNTGVNKTNVDTPTLVQQATRRRDAPVFYGGIVFNFSNKSKKAKETKETKFEFDNGSDR